MKTDAHRNLVAKFLEKCVIYANESIARKESRGDEPEEISKWITYRDFTEHALMEVRNGDLDGWFEEE
ncbi:MAG: hypothetical protein CMA12_02130 [Euryarchaeota archaeon]|nr:hypothetical protein [Euryarchaeota archaeon]OUW22839.1 MAG: hypothetical protein CBD33_00705 [Euryarchaeota archaeon TMED173]|tara:strand:- start:984 stop:1187 length:204 start_codon:yes stop_codon:yes gene_type:complete